MHGVMVLSQEINELLAPAPFIVNFLTSRSILEMSGEPQRVQ
jgi:hypothetical protein